MLRLKFLRLERGLTQRQLAQQTQLYHSQICQMEAGRLNPRAEELHRLGEALGCPPARLLDHVVDILPSREVEAHNAQGPRS